MAFLTEILFAVLCAFGAVSVIWCVVGLFFRLFSKRPARDYAVYASTAELNAGLEQTVMDILLNCVFPYGGRVFIIDAGMDGETLEIAHRIADTYKDVHIVKSEEQREKSE